jgi:hypothetical protein
MKFFALTTIAFCQFQRQNGLDAQRLDQAKSLVQDGDACSSETVCAGDKIGQCVNRKIVTTSCGSGLSCQVLPLVNKLGTSVACTTEEDKQRRLAAALGTLDRNSKLENTSASTIKPTNSNILAKNTASELGAKNAVQAGAPNTFECIDDTRFKLFTGNGQFSIGSCPPGFCASRNPPNKNPCIGKARADQIDNKI